MIGGVSCLLIGCTGAQRDPKADAAREYVKEVTGLSEEDLRAGGGGLRVSTNDVTTDGRHIKIRGRIENGYSEPVEGIRYLVGFFGDGEQPTLLGTYQHEVDTTLEPGDSKLMVINAESMYLGGGRRFDISATPIKLGGRDVPPPPEWK